MPIDPFQKLLDRIPKPDHNSDEWRTENPCCIACWGFKPQTTMILCPKCGNKRCPKATDHNNRCTASNEPGQDGSAY